MLSHLHLFLVLLLALLFSGMRTYNGFQRDWCGIRLFPAILLAALPSLLTITLIYISLVDVAAFPPLRKYWLLISAGAAVISENAAGRILRALGPPTARADGAKVPLSGGIASKIMEKKVAVVNQLEREAQCRGILENAINAAPGLSAARKRALSKKLGHPPSRDQIFEVMDVVGLAILKHMVPRG